jgi:hypothetical protein
MPPNPIPLERRLARQFFRRLPARDYSSFLTEPLNKRWNHPAEEKKEKTAAQIAEIVMTRCKIAALSPEEFTELAGDLQEQDLVRGREATKAVLPEKNIQGLLSQIQKGSKQQTLMGLGGGVAGGLVGGASGALLGALSKGKQYAPVSGMLGIIPGVVGGHLVGKQLQQRRELVDLLRENNLKNIDNRNR